MIACYIFNLCHIHIVEDNGEEDSDVGWLYTV